MSKLLLKSRELDRPVVRGQGGNSDLALDIAHRTRNLRERKMKMSLKCKNIINSKKNHTFPFDSVKEKSWGHNLKGEENSATGQKKTHTYTPASPLCLPPSQIRLMEL